MSTRQEIFRFNQICCVVELVQSMSKYNFLMVFCEDCQSQTLFVVHVLKFLTSPINHSQFNYMYIQKVEQSQTHFSTQKLRRQRFFQNYPIVHWSFVTIVNETELPHTLSQLTCSSMVYWSGFELRNWKVMGSNPDQCPCCWWRWALYT